MKFIQAHDDSVRDPRPEIGTLDVDHLAGQLDSAGNARPDLHSQRAQLARKNTLQARRSHRKEFHRGENCPFYARKSTAACAPRLAVGRKGIIPAKEMFHK